MPIESSKKRDDTKATIWSQLQKASAGSLQGSSRIVAIAIIYENPRNIALPEARKLGELLVAQYKDPDFIPHNLFIDTNTKVMARKLVYGREISETSGLDTAESNKILAEMLAASIDLDRCEAPKAMAFTGDSPALGQTFFAVLADSPRKVTSPKPLPGRPTVQKPTHKQQRSSRSHSGFPKWVLAVGLVLVLVAISIPLGIGLMSGLKKGTPTPEPTPMGGGGRIVFVSEREGNPDIYVMAPDGTNVTRLTDDPANDLDPAWSPDRQQIAFVSDREGDFDIYTINADGTNLVRLAAHKGRESHPVWSPDGQRIAFSSDRDGDSEIYVVHRDGSNLTNLTNSPGFDTSPAWSPSGKLVAFASWRQDRLKIYVMNADGSDVRQLTSDQTLDCDPVWSPNGQHIAFISGAGSIDDKPVTSVYLLENGLMFASSGGVFDTHSVDTSICVINADGSDKKMLSEGWAPTWSPDGQHIVFASDHADTIAIYAANPDGSDVTRLTNNPTSDYAPAWGASPVQAAILPIASIPSPTPQPVERATNTPSPAPAFTSTPPPTATPTNTSVPTAMPTSTPSPIPTSTSTPPPTAAPTSTPTPMREAASSALGSLILFDAFDSNANDWPMGDHNDSGFSHQWQIASGRYRWKIDTRQDVHWYVHPDISSVSDFSLTVEAQQVSGTDDSNYGVVFRVLDSQNFYHFAINSSQEFILLRKYKDRWTRLIDWTRSPVINPGKMNRLMVVAQGSHFGLYINDQPVGEADDDKLRKGKAGLTMELYNAGDEAIFEFDNFELRHLPEDATVSGRQEILFQDHFDANVNNWQIGEFANENIESMRQIVDGRYRLSLDVKTEGRASLVPIPGFSGRDFLLTVDGAIVERADSQEGQIAFVIVLCGQEYCYYVNFWSDGGFGVYEFGTEGKWIQNTATPSVLNMRPRVTNSLGLLVKDASITLYANDQELGSVSDIALDEVKVVRIGIWGRDVGQASTADFDNLIIWSK